jgi:hypothetical protein
VTTTAVSGPPPAAPGSLTAPPTASDVLAYLDKLGHWVVALREALDNLDARAQVAHDPVAYTQDIVLAMSLWNSIDARRQELETAWDSGRVLEDELAKIATLIWGRLADPLGAPSAFTLPEACTLAAALQDRLSAVLAQDAVAGSGAAQRIEPLRAALQRCRLQAAALGVPITRIDELAAALESAVKAANAQVVAEVIDRVDREVAITERDLIKEASRRAGVAFQYAELRRRYDDLATMVPEVAELAHRCEEKIADAPRLGVPSIAVLGEPPALEPGRRDQHESAAAADELASYAEKLTRFGAALAVARDRFSAPLQEREDLRGLLEAYRDRTARGGLAEDAALEDRFRAAHDVLWTAPCDLPVARRLVAEYQRAVRLAVGADVAVEPSAVDATQTRERS